MGKRGPLPKSIERKKLEGNPGKRQLKKPKDQVAAPSKHAPPEHLSPLAAAEWRRLYTTLRASGLLSMTDLPAFELYCVRYGQWREAEAELQNNGPIVKASNGAMVPSPFFRVARLAATALLASMDKLGLTPAARMRMEIGASHPPLPDDDDDPEDDFGKFAGLIGRQKEHH